MPFMRTLLWPEVLCGHPLHISMCGVSSRLVSCHYTLYNPGTDTNQPPALTWPSGFSDLLTLKFAFLEALFPRDFRTPLVTCPRPDQSSFCALGFCQMALEGGVEAGGGRGPGRCHPLKPPASIQSHWHVLLHLIVELIKDS